MPITYLLIQIGIVLLTSLLLGRLLKKLDQPSVIAEILSGIVLGPSLLGLIAPDAMTLLFPEQSMELLGTVAQLGLVFFMFLVGLELDPKLLQTHFRSAVLVSTSSIAVPLVAGAAVAFMLPEVYAGASTSHIVFATFVGVAMSVTAFPVLARILTEQRLLATPVGTMSLAAAAVGDLVAWCMLALVVGFASSAGMQSAFVTVGLTAIYMVFAWFVVRPVLQRLGPREGRIISIELMSVAVLLIIVSALITEFIGIHALFGGFIIGLAMPRTGGLHQTLAEKLEDFVTVVLLPLYFAYSGLRTNFWQLEGASDLAITFALLVVATLGKFAGAALAARKSGLNNRESSAVGVLMNTRGLMEIVILNVGLDLGVIGERIFAMLIIVAVATTWMTTPIIRWLYHPKTKTSQEGASQRAGIMVAVSDPHIAAPLVWLAASLRRSLSEPLWVVHLIPVERPHQYLRQEKSLSEPLEEVAITAKQANVDYEAIQFSSSDPAEDLIKLSNSYHARIILLGTHRTTLGSDSLGGITGELLKHCKATVAILYDRGLTTIRRVLIDATGDYADTVRDLGDQISANGAEVLENDPETQADIKVCSFSRHVRLSADSPTSFLLVRSEKPES